ncbi:hypothetical protein BH09MYX1_BH09MYX1_18010 [soil metagenome]
MTDLLKPPPDGYHRIAEYRIGARAKRSFHGILDAAKLLPSGSSTTRVELTRKGNDVTLTVDNPLRVGSMRDELRADATASGVLLRSLVRELKSTEGGVIRREEVHDFSHDVFGFDRATYPEVALPFLLPWLPLDGRKTLYAWINDRFVARVYLERGASAKLDLPIGQRRAIEVVMYPDLNDWVPLGALLSRRAKPFTPKYHMWFDETSRELVRFEGPYGPPGAAEIVFELEREE